MEQLILVLATIGMTAGACITVICGARLIRGFIEDIRTRQNNEGNSFKYLYSQDDDEGFEGKEVRR
ncbi:MAG: hypothetical protein M0R49_07935 [Limnochordia bacterium]|jgi:hypothetical protein|nr:hypothetical protein [Limnochordia bacterium]